MARVSDLLAAGRTFSFEFFPPQSDSAQLSLGRAIAELEPLAPSFVSVTYGAGGSSRQRTREVVSWVRRETAITPMAHLTCQGHTRAEIAEILEDYRAAGIENILALGGDPPKDPADAKPSDYAFAFELVDDIAHGDFAVGVAAHPELHPRSPDREADRRFLAAKLASADFAITQFFFEPEPYLRLVDELAALGCDKPVVPGIMPVTNAGQVARMASMSGAAVPTWLRERLEGVDDPVEVRNIGVDVASTLCSQLLESGAPGLHFYTLNRSTATREIYANLGLGAAPPPVTTQITRPLEWHPPRAAISAVPYLPGLDGMRAIAVMAVMVYHANSSWLPGGFLGVEVFFVISGYLITLLLIGEHERTGTVSLRHFWLRRARRLLPALFVLLIGVTLFTAFFRRDALGQLRGDVIAALTYVTNWYQIWVGQGYTASGDFAPLRHLWSLAVEEQFYLLWPLAMIGLISLGRRRLPGLSRLLFAAAVLVTVVMALLYYEGPIETCELTPEAYWQVGGRCLSKTDTLYLGTFTRLGGLLLGAAFAMVWRPVAIMRGPMRTKAHTLDALALVGLLGLGALCWYLYLVDPSGADPWLFRGGFFVCGIATLMIIAAATHQRSWTGPLLGNPVLLWVGTRSYGLYLFSWPVYQAIRRVSGNPLTFPQFLLGVTIAAVITEASYRFVETPIRKGHVGRWWRNLQTSRDPAPRRLVATAAACLVAVSVFAGASLATAELQTNEIAQDLAENQEESVDDLTDLITTTTEPEPATTRPPVETTTAPTTATPTTGAIAVPVTSVAPATVPPTAPPAAPPPTAAPPPPALPTIAVGDSVMLGAAEELAARGIIVSAVESRQMNTTTPELIALRDSGQLGNAVVVHLGTNGPISTETVDAFFGALAGVPKVVMLTAHADRSWIPPTNEKLYEVPAKFPNVTLVDWNTLAAQCPDDCFYDDGIHINQAGQNYYAQLIFTALGI